MDSNRPNKAPAHHVDVSDYLSHQKIVVIDNFDSFVYNLVQYIGETGAHPIVFRADKIDLKEVAALKPDGILISPGPGHPKEATLSNEILSSLSQEIPTFGVCLGHQCIGEVFGAEIVRAKILMHGKTSEITHDARGVFVGMAQSFRATRYHSLVIEPSSVPPELEISAHSNDGYIMGVRHREYPIEGVQFHPESILTEQGRTIVRNFLDMTLAKV